MITEEILESAAENCIKILRQIPKTDLHLHSALSAPFSTYLELSGGRLSSPPEKFPSLFEFLKFVHDNHLTLLGHPDFFRATTEGMFSFLIEDGVTYCEPSFDIRLPRAVGISWKEFAEQYKNCCRKIQDRLIVKPDLGIMRMATEADWKESSFEALDLGIFNGIDIYDDELANDLTRFIPLFDYARKKGCKIKIHSGEVGSPERIRRDIEIANPDVLQHGVRSAEDPALMKEIAAANIQLNICLASNLKLSVAKDYQSHPIRRLFDEGIKVTLNSDDYGVFHSSVSDDFLSLHQNKIFTAKELEVIRQYGIWSA